MLSSLPGLAPRDSYALWYTPTHHSSSPLAQQDLTNNAIDHLAPTSASGQNNPHRRQHASAAYRSPLARLRADEQYMERRKVNVQNYGNSWIKPPGIPKSLYQLREEKREMEEHQEAMRREALAQELAEAEGAEDLLQGEGPDGDMGETRDLDDDIPEADTTGVDAEDSENEEADDDDDDAEEVSRVSRIPDDVYIQALARASHPFGDEEGSVTDEDEQSQMLQEEDLSHDTRIGNSDDLNMGMDMDADLDDDVPEGENGEYEHTDTEAELTSSDEDESVDMGRLPHGPPLNSSIVRSDGTQNSMGLSSMDLRSGSSILGSSPRQRTGPGRDGRRERTS